MDFLIRILAAHAQWVLYGTTLILGALALFVVMRRGAFRLLSIRAWWGIVVTFEILYAAALTIAQRHLWGINDISRELIQIPLGSDVPRLLIHLPVQPFLDGRGGYYVFYAYTHFWLPILVALVGSLCVYGIFVFLQHRKPVAIAHEEVLLVSSISFLAGWPNMVAFVALAFVFALLHTVYAHIRHDASTRTRMLTGIIIAAIFVLTFSTKIATYTSPLAF